MSIYDNDKNKPQLNWVKSDLLKIDDTYQRSADGTRSQLVIDKIIKYFNWNEFAPLVVAKTPEGFFNIVDGQHRFIAATKLKIESLPCWIINSNKTSDQAETFLGINKNRVQINPFSLYKANIAKGDETALKIEAFCEENKIEIPASGYVNRANQTLALACIGKHLNKHNDAYLSEAIKLIREAIPYLYGQLRPDILDTLVRIKIEYGSKVKNSEIISALRMFEDTKVITNKAKQLKQLDSGIKLVADAHFKVFCSKIAEVRKGAKNV